MIERSYGQPAKAEPVVEPAPPEQEAPASPVAALQRRAGNAATLAAIGAQGKLTVGAANDPAEREADRVAREVVARLTSGESPAPAAPGKKGDGVIGRIMQRHATVGAEGGDVDKGLEREIDAARGGGAPLAPDVRRSMEDGFGADFGAVRVHTGSQAADLNRQVQAKAFTIGNDVFFGQGGPDTSSRAGTELLAHELTHVVQQGGAGVSRTIDRKADDEEKEVESSEGGGDAVEEAKSTAEEETEGDEAESSESESAESAPAAVGPMSGTIGSGSGPDSLQIIKDPGERAADLGAARAFAAADRDGSGGGAIPIVLGGTTVHTSQPQRKNAGGKRDALAGNLGTVGWSNPGGQAVDAFGEESFEVSYTGASWAMNKPGDPIEVNFNLEVRCPWGVNGDGAIDIPNAASPLITADNVDQVVHDLTPIKVEKSWRAPRDTFWSQAICERHERFHSTDDRDWARGAGKDRFANFVSAKSIPLKPKERTKPEVISRRVKRVLDQAVADMKVANMEFYTGGAGSYYSYAGEERAFGDGKQPYVQLADAIRARGEVLKAEQAENAQTTTSVKDKAKFFDRLGKGDRKTR